MAVSPRLGCPAGIASQAALAERSVCFALLGLPRVGESKVSDVKLQRKHFPFRVAGWAIFSYCHRHRYRTGRRLLVCLCTCLLSSSGTARGDTVTEETLKV